MPFPALSELWRLLTGVLALVAGTGYLLGFTPPTVFRRAWQEPELRAFLGRAARLPRLPSTDQIVRALEHGAATATGAPNATIGLWDEPSGVLRFSHASGELAVPSGATIAGQAFAAERAMFSENAPRDDPFHAEMYRTYGATAVVAAPITAGEKRLGVLVVYAPKAPIFAEDDLELVQLLADQAAVILESRVLIDEAARVRAREEATRLRDDFLAAAAHDLKTPLTTLLTQTQVLERRAMRNPEAPPDLAGIQRLGSEVRRLNNLVLELLDAARAEQGKLVGPRETVDVVALAQEACARFATDRHPCVLEAVEPVVGDYDRNRIVQLLQNLLENAVKYSPGGGELRIKLWREHGEAHLSVSDQGIGISAPDLSHIFERYQQGTGIDDRRFAGMGLGLYICQAIAEQHGGRIWATSPGPGKGSTFHVVLPLPSRVLVA